MHRPSEKKVTRQCVEAKFAEVEAALANARPPTRRQRHAAAAECFAQPETPEGPTWRAPWGLVGLVLLFVVLMLVVGLAGCVPVEAIEQARDQAAIEHGHAVDERHELPLEARQRAADSERAWQAQHRALTGDPVPGSEAWPPLPPELAPVGTEAHCPDGYDLEALRARGGDPPVHCGCGARACSMPCTTCCAPEPCPCTLPDPSVPR